MWLSMGYPDFCAGSKTRRTGRERSGTAEMGRSGRRKMEREFDQALVLDKYLQALRAACPALLPRRTA